MLTRLSLPLLALAFAFGLQAAEPMPPEPTPSNPENTGRNVRDKAPESLLPTDQSNAPDDLKATQDIRRAVMADGTLSTNAKNAKIITTESVVVLRGPVDSQAERDQLAAYAKSAAGSRTVHNELEVRTEK